MLRFIYIIALILIITGCSNNEELVANDKSSSKATVTDNHKTLKKQEKKYNDSPQATEDASLTKVGESYKDNDGLLKLKAIKPLDKVYEIGPIRLRIQDVKVLHYLPADHLLDFFHDMSPNGEYDEFDYIKFKVVVENTSDQNVKFAPVGLLTFNTGDSLTWEDDFYLEELNGEIRGKKKKVGNMGFILNNTDIAKLKWLEITTSDVLDMNNNKLHNNKKIKIKMN